MTAAPVAAPAPMIKMGPTFNESLPVNAKPTPKLARMVANYPDMIRRISPYGKVCVTGKPCGVVVAAPPRAPGAPDQTGEEVYTAVCTGCHGSGMLGAPKTGNAGDWGPRKAKGKETLYNHAINGFNAMPARGGNAELKDQEVKNGVDYMLSKI